MKRVTGIGGIFFKANDPDKLRDWYRAHLGIECEKEGGAIFKWRRADDIAAFIVCTDEIVLGRSLLPRRDSLGDIDVKVLLHFQSAET